MSYLTQIATFTFFSDSSALCMEAPFAPPVETVVREDDYHADDGFNRRAEKVATWVK